MRPNNIQVWRRVGIHQIGAAVAAKIDSELGHDIINMAGDLNLGWESSCRLNFLGIKQAGQGVGVGVLGLAKLGEVAPGGGAVAVPQPDLDRA
jgi:hypothetical protein